MRLFKNREDLDFGMVSDMEPVQAFDVSEDPRGEIEYPTMVAKFQGVHHLTIHFPECIRGDETEIGFIGLKGEHVDVSAQRAAAHPRVGARGGRAAG